MNGGALKGRSVGGLWDSQAMCGCDQCRADRLIERLKRRGVDNAVLIPLREMRDNVPADCLVYGGRIAAMSDEDIRRMNVWARVTVQRNAATV